MSFKCGFCKKTVGYKIQPTFIVTKSRERSYVDETGVEFSKGWEIVKEKKACKECAEKHKSVPHEVIEVPPKSDVIYSDDKPTSSAQDLKKKFNGRQDNRQERY